MLCVRMLIACGLTLMVIGAEELPAKAQRLVDKFHESVREAETERDEAIAKIQQKHAQVLTEAQSAAVRGLKRAVSSRAPFAEQAAIFKTILTLDRTDEDAVEFFTAIGTINQVLADLEPVVEADFLGNLTVQAPTTNDDEQAAQEPPAPENLIVRVYGALAFTGPHGDFVAEGSYGHNQLILGNDRIQSMKVRPGFEVELFQHGGFAASMGVFTGAVENIEGGVSGMIIRRQQ